MKVFARALVAALLVSGLGACGPRQVVLDGSPDAQGDAISEGIVFDVPRPDVCPGGSAERCDGIDNDCDGRVDNGAVCPGVLACVAGACACPAGHQCGATCSDLATDDANCGACGNACATGFACRGGTCGCATAGQTACGGLCVDLLSDRHHCGACPNDCGTSASCVSGTCTPGGPVALDLLLMVDNSNSMRENQSNLMSQFSTMLATLTSPPCVSTSNPTPHTCNPSDPADHLQYPAVTDLHVGVVSSDLGTPGSSVPGCVNSDLGDDGLLNPIRNGQALMRHEPWTTAPPTFGRPTDCMDPNQFPAFISFSSGTTNLSTFTHDLQCNAGLYVNGCGLESQLDSVYRALIIHDATDHPGNTSPNAGFLRDAAPLAILMLTDEDDGSVRDCRFANGAPCVGQGAIDVYNPASTAWASMELNLRFYMYQPCGPQDPMWPLERYIDPANPTAGLLSLKPGHPERILFAAITGVPIAIPMIGSGSTAHVDWNRLVGAPGPDPEDFCGRDSSGLGSLTSPEGPISMQQANADPNCAQRTVPACRRQGTTYSPTACTTTDQYFAWPARRIAEVARRFDESPLCGGAPCRNGFISSICDANYHSTVGQIAGRVLSLL